MGQQKSKLVQPEDGNLENDQIIAQKLKQNEKEEQNANRRKLSLFKLGEKKNKEVIQVTDAELFGGETDPKSLPATTSPTSSDKTVDKEQESENVTEKEAEKADSEETKVNAADSCPEHDDDDDKEEEKSPADAALDKEKYAVNTEHVKEKITEFTDSMKVTDKHSAKNLLDIFKKLKVTKEEFGHWKGNYGTVISSKQDAKNKMKSVIDYAESNSSCTPAVKVKLRVVTKLIMESDAKTHSDYKGIFLLIAQHGNVCNVMKEVAINNAYGIMTGSLDDEIKAQSLKEQVLRCLRDYRVLLVEEVFHAFKFTNNTHYIAGFHNTLAEQIGVPQYNDPNICYPSSSQHPEWKKNLDKRYFHEYYTLDKILKYVLVQIDCKKIGYQKIVRWFEENCPPNMEKQQFLEQVIDIDTGKISENYMCWLLEKMQVFQVKDEDWKPIEKCWS